MREQTQNDRLLTASELAQRWGLHRATVLRMFHAGSIPGLTLVQGAGKSTIRFRPSAILAFERAHERSELRDARRAQA